MRCHVYDLPTQLHSPLIRFMLLSDLHQAELYFHAGHLLPQSSAAEKETQQDVWSSSSDTKPASMAGRETADSRSGARDGSDLTDMTLSDALPASRGISASTSTESEEESQAASTQSDPSTVLASSVATPPAVLQKPERRPPQPEQVSPEEPSAPGAGRGTRRRAIGKHSSHEPWESAAALQALYGRPAASAKPSKPAGIQKRQPAVIPHVAALGALVGALARASELDQALQLYKQVSLLAVAWHNMCARLVCAVDA